MIGQIIDQQVKESFVQNKIRMKYYQVRKGERDNRKEEKRQTTSSEVRRQTNGKIKCVPNLKEPLKSIVADCRGWDSVKKNNKPK